MASVGATSRREISFFQVLSIRVLIFCFSPRTTKYLVNVGTPKCPCALKLLNLLRRMWLRLCVAGVEKGQVDHAHAPKDFAVIGVIGPYDDEVGLRRTGRLRSCFSGFRQAHRRSC